jgi:tripartite-type tricarboxylate transporter receptor subunit TctC
MNRTASTLLSVPASRRRVLTAAGGAALGLATLGLAGPARAQSYPTRPVRVVIAFPPGGATDILARNLSQRLSSRLGQQFVVENRPGAGGVIGLEAAARSPADGYNVFLCALTNTAIATHLYPRAPAHIARDFDPVSMLANAPHVLNLHPSVPARTVPEFVQWLKANDGRINYASQGNGTLSHLESELLAQRIGVKLVHVPYRGSALALPDLLAGNVSFMFDSVAASMVHIRSGALRALAVAATSRVSALPDLPTLLEAGVTGYDVDNWFGLFVPKGAPAAAGQRLGAELAQILRDPEMIGSLQQQGFEVATGDAARLAAVTAAEIQKWGEVVKAANVTVS